MPSGRMTKMHFIAIATTLGNLKPDRGNKYATATVKAKGSAAYAQWRATVVEFASMCQASNGRFDRARFYAACGFEE